MPRPGRPYLEPGHLRSMVKRRTMIISTLTAASLALIGGFLSAPVLVDEAPQPCPSSIRQGPIDSCSCPAPEPVDRRPARGQPAVATQSEPRQPARTCRLSPPAAGQRGAASLSVVTKTPRKMNIERNGSDTDNITALVVAQGLPPATWSSLLARANYQADELRRRRRKAKARCGSSAAAPAAQLSSPRAKDPPCWPAG